MMMMKDKTNVTASASRKPKFRHQYAYTVSETLATRQTAKTALVMNWILGGYDFEKLENGDCMTTMVDARTRTRRNLNFEGLGISKERMPTSPRGPCRSVRWYVLLEEE